MAGAGEVEPDPQWEVTHALSVALGRGGLMVHFLTYLIGLLIVM